MRNNQPITNREVFMEDGSIIVSKTDDKGRIEFVNKDFIDISRFEKDELIGQPHNLIRHPDMPAEAFEDMWRDLKAGLPWNGYVKNRVKNGDHYWVNATAMPVMESGRLTGYISIRSKPDAETIKAVEPIYQRFRDGKADGLAIEHGRVINHGFKSRAGRWYSKLGSKVTAMGVVLCLMIALVGGAGIFVTGSVKESLRTVYEDRTIPAGQLADIEKSYYDIFLELYAVSSTKKNVGEVTKIVEENLQTADKIWTEYMATYLTPEEVILAKDYAEKRDQMRQNVLMPAFAMLKAGRLDEIASFLAVQNATTDVVAEALDKLLTLQMDVAKEEYIKSKKQAMMGLFANMGAMFFAVIVALIASKKVRGFLKERINYLDTRLNSIAGGNYTTEVTVGDDELGPILVTVKALQAKLAYGELEKKELERDKKVSQQQLANDFERSVKGIVQTVAAAATELSQTASNMVTTVMESSQKATDASGAASSTSSNVQTVAAAAEELSASVREISSQLQKTTQLVSQSREKSQSADVVANELSKASDKVTKAMEMISEIAGQINLLALNATIESARAGDAGKGFAVVASEVKNLATQTDKTVAEIQLVAEDMRKASQAIIVALGEIGGSVDSISQAASSVASAVEEQSATTNEIARSMQNAATGTQTISDNLDEVRASSTHAGAASEQMLAASEELSKQAEVLNTQVDGFLQKIRAA